MYFHGPGLGETPIPSTIPYKEPFPALKAQRPDLHRQAMAAQLALLDLRNFKPVFSLLQAATGNSYLSLDRLDRVVVEPDHQATSDLLGPSF